MALKLKDLEEARSFYKVELEKGDLAGGERNSYLKALKLIEKIIKEKERSGEKENHKEFIAYGHTKGGDPIVRISFS